MSETVPAGVDARTAILDGASRLKDRIDALTEAVEGECDGLAITPDQAIAILEHLDGPAAPALPTAEADELRAARSLKDLVWTDMPKYGELSFDQLREAVSEANIGDRHHMGPFDPAYYPGHQQVGGCNYNSLNRIVTAFIRAALATTPETAKPGDLSDDDLEAALREAEIEWGRWQSDGIGGSGIERRMEALNAETIRRGWDDGQRPETAKPDTSAADGLREALEIAANDLHVIQTLNSHGASDRTYIDWLRANAAEAERRIRKALAAALHPAPATASSGGMVDDDYGPRWYLREGPANSWDWSVEPWTDEELSGFGWKQTEYVPASTIEALSKQVADLTKERDEAQVDHDAELEEAHTEGYNEGYEERKCEARGAHGRVFRFIYRWLKDRGLCFDDGEGINEHDVADGLALFQREPVSYERQRADAAEKLAEQRRARIASLEAALAEQSRRADEAAEDERDQFLKVLSDHARNNPSSEWASIAANVVIGRGALLPERRAALRAARGGHDA